jgi:Ca2+-binding RTX toxin-like protein
MSGTRWNAEFYYLVMAEQNGSWIGAMGIGGEAGADSVTVNWGYRGPNGIDPLIETYEPTPGGDFYLPSSDKTRLYNDGSYTITTTASMPDGPDQTETLTLFLDLNGTVGVRRSGSSATDDMMGGGSGADSFYGNGGDDWLYGGLGGDRLSGGDGNDMLDGDGTGGRDEGADTLYGGRGDDRLEGRGGDDWLDGGSDDDELNGGTGADTLFGGNGNDTLDGGDGDDRLSAGAGADVFIGGLGRDRLVSTADGDMDLFVMRTLAERGDRIIGFETGIDRVELSFLSTFAMSEDRFVGSAAEMTERGPYLIYDEARGILWYDSNGAAAGATYTLAWFTAGTELAFGDFVFGV